MTAKRESAFTELLDILRTVRDVLRHEHIDPTLLLCAFGFAFVANWCFWLAIATSELVANEIVHEEARHLALEMLYTADVAGVLALICLYISVRKRLLAKLFPNRLL